ncbi:peptidoglycan-binding domain-containing protein [Luteitalea pratensis]|uniref:peptidoglycan-binding domain-containing protein n=1 Tax=Luteitalea pratensis TaxID=1855912 RepID=UPI001F27D3AD|nr:peptidoglycan-binding domain-containing protein [Luteitalea pratensis]
MPLSTFGPDPATYNRWLQRSLNTVLRASLVVDGRRGPETVKKIKEFQRKKGLDPNGEIGMMTEDALAAAAGEVPPTFGQNFRFPGAVNGTAEQALKLLEKGTKPVLLNDDAVALDRTLFIDVRMNGAAPEVLAWRAPVAGWAPGPLEPTRTDVVRLNSSDQLEALLQAKDTLVRRGDRLPSDWQHAVKRRGVSDVYISERSPKRTLKEHVAAARALEHRYDPERTRIFNGLPRIDSERSLVDQIVALGLRLDQEPAFRQLAQQIHDVETAAQRPLDVAEKSAILEELQNGSNDTIVLVAHSQDGNIRLPGGEWITPKELAEIQRPGAPPRAFVLFSCDTGTVNGATAGVGEILLASRVAANVIAPPGPIDARPIPTLLSRFLTGEETLGDVFTGAWSYSISLRLEGVLPAQASERGR